MFHTLLVTKREKKKRHVEKSIERPNCNPHVYQMSYHYGSHVSFQVLRSLPSLFSLLFDSCYLMFLLIKFTIDGNGNKNKEEEWSALRWLMNNSNNQHIDSCNEKKKA